MNKSRLLQQRYVYGGIICWAYSHLSTGYVIYTYITLTAVCDNSYNLLDKVSVAHNRDKTRLNT